MAGNLLPLVLVGGAAVVLSGKKKKRRKKSAPAEEVDVATEGSKTLPPSDIPEGFGVGETVDEADLDYEDDPTGAEAGDFEEKTEKLPQDENEVFGEPVNVEVQAQQAQHAVNQQASEMKDKCDAFINEIHLIPTEADEMPVNKIAVEQSIIPAMKGAAIGLHQNLGLPYDEEAMGPQMVLSALESVAPECGWEYSDAAGEFRYAGGVSAHSGKVGDVLTALFDLTVMILDDLRGGQIPETQQAQFMQGEA